jgi:H+/Cl- antiporter ClcA
MARSPHQAEPYVSQCALSLILAHLQGGRMRIAALIDKRAIQHGRRLWLHYGVFWLGAIATGLVAVLYAQLIDLGYNTFLRYATRYWWLPLPVTPVVGALGVWLTRRYFPGSEGSGIPQVIATLHDNGSLAPRLLSIRILVGKILVSFLAILGGFTIGREGPTIHVGAALMYNLRRFYPARFRAIRALNWNGGWRSRAPRRVCRRRSTRRSPASSSRSKN